MGFFSKKTTTLEDQIRNLESCGLKLSPQARLDDLFQFAPRGQMEKTPYKDIIAGLALDQPREPFLPVCPRIWLCDYERIEDTGDYKGIVERLNVLTDNSLGLRDIVDSVDIEDGIAWVEFNLAGSKIRWDLEFDQDWMDPDVVVKYDQLLTSHRTGFRIYSNHDDYGQSALFAGFRIHEWEKFRQIAQVKLAPIADQT